MRATNRLEAKIDALQALVEKQVEKIDAVQDSVGEIRNQLRSLEDRVSLTETRVAFFSTQSAGSDTPERVRRVAGGYGLLEPRSTWRRERPYRR